MISIKSFNITAKPFSYRHYELKFLVSADNHNVKLSKDFERRPFKRQKDLWKENGTVVELVISLYFLKVIVQMPAIVMILSFVDILIFSK